jgi:uncharacterized protein (TIGR00255 family)
MIKSMTGFGSTVVSDPALGEISVEIRSLNNRFLDFSVRLPRELNSAEARLRDEVKKRLRRGKVDMFVRYVPAAGAQVLYDINAHALQHYARQLADAAPMLPGGASAGLDMNALLQLPGVVTPGAVVSEDGPLVQLLLTAVSQVLDLLEQARKTEGNALARAISGHLDKLSVIRGEIEQVKDELLEHYRQRLKDRMEVLGNTFEVAMDPARIETEIMLYADKSDITEELVRLDAHFVSFRKLLEASSGEAVGKSMDFLVQELLRETNTIGNKARGVTVASKIVQMKSEIEKIREQVQNLE